jgi:nitrate/nitrite transport system ATP-binding protein
MTEQGLRLDGIIKNYAVRKSTVQVLSPTTFGIERGEFVTLIGPSGCGKSTLLGIVAGLTEPDGGELTLDGAPITGPGRDRGVVFQQHVLLPWLSARDNILFALDTARGELPAQERSDLADRYLELVHLTAAADKRPGQLSGGMRQRVGIARALALQPKMLLLDEPFGALDALTRATLQRELLHAWESERRTVMMVTHDVDEAILLSDRILVMSHGPQALIIRDIRVPFSRPREADLLAQDPTYFELRAALLSALIREPVSVPAERPVTI